MYTLTLFPDFTDDNGLQILKAAMKILIFGLQFSDLGFELLYFCRGPKSGPMFEPLLIGRENKPPQHRKAYHNRHNEHRRHKCEIRCFLSCF